MNADAFLEVYRTYQAKNLSQDDSGNYSSMDFVALLRPSLIANPELHKALQTDAFEVIGSSQLEQRDLAVQLVKLQRAFRLLEQAAINLYHYPWRKEYRIVKTFSGDYVHLLKPVLSEDDIAEMLGKMGYVMRRDTHGFVNESVPSASELLKVACGFLAMQLECEILAEILAELDVGTVSLADLILVRRRTHGIEACTEKLRRLVLQKVGTGDHVGSARSDIQPAAEYLDSVDIYRDTERNPDIGHVTQGLPGAGTLCSLAEPDSLLPRYQPQFCDSCHESWDSHPRQFCSPNHKENESLLSSTECYKPSKCMTHLGEDMGFNADDYYSASSSPTPEEDPFIQHSELHLSKSPSQNYSDSSDPGNPEAHIHIPLSDGGTYSLHDCMFQPPALMYKCQKCSVLHGSECVVLQGCRSGYHFVPGILPSEAEAILKAVEQQRYKAHYCLSGKSSPHYQCKTCRELHYIKCPGMEACKSARHPVRMLFREQDQAWWLRKTEQEALLVKGLSETQTQTF